MLESGEHGEVLPEVYEVLVRGEPIPRRSFWSMLTTKFVN
jgi:hypothetical protein